MATISSIITFVPTIGGNNEKDDREKFSVKLKAVGYEQKQAQLRKFIEMDPNKLMAQMMDPRQQSEIKQILEKHFVRFENFFVAVEATDEDVTAKRKGRVNGEEVEITKVGQEYERLGTINDVFELGEFELAMEIFMHVIGSSQLRKTLTKALPAEGATVTQEREDEEKNSGSPSGTTLTSVV